MTFNDIQKDLNSLFIFQLKQPLKQLNKAQRSTLINEHPTKSSIKKTLSLLKGQIIIINKGQHMIFMNSPHVRTFDDLINSNLFLSDFPLHDNTRDLIMLNQSQILQKDLK